MSKFRRQLMMASMSEPVPPTPTYRDVFYIQNKSGLGYIDTGFKPNQNTNVSFEMIPTNDRYLYGARNAAREKNFGFYAWAANAKPRFDFGNNVYTGSSSLHLSTQWVGYNEGRVMHMNVEGSDYTITANENTFQCEHNLLLFGTNNNGTPSVSDCGPVMSFKVYDNGILIRDYKPKQRISDGVYGLWDDVNSTFNVSANSELFSGGSREDIILNYQAVANAGSDNKVSVSSSNAFNQKRATLLQLRTNENAIDWNSNTPASISSRYTLPHKEGDTLKVTLNNASYYCALNVFARNGSTYSVLYSGGWTAGALTADLSSYTGDEVWINVNFKFNSGGTASVILLDSDYTLEWI